MDELTISSPTEEPAELRRRFVEEGYLLVRGLLPYDFINAVSGAIESQFRSGGWLDGSRATLAATVARPGTDPTYRSIARSAVFNCVPYRSELRACITALLQERAFPYPSKVLRATPPARYTTEAGRFTHQDFAYWGVTDMVTTWTPLIRIPRELGGLAIRPGSHRQGPIELTVLEGDEPGWATLDYELGDVLLFHSLTAHAVLPNLTDALRVSGDFRWQPVSSPVKREFIFGRQDQERELFSKSFGEEPWWQPIPPDVILRVGEWGVHVPPVASRFVEVSEEWTGWTGPSA